MFCELPEFGRCCFCMPLRRGILVFGYLNILFSMFMVGLYSYSIHHNSEFVLLYHGGTITVDSELCIAIYCADVMFNILLVYGAHRVIFLKNISINLSVYVFMFTKQIMLKLHFEMKIMSYLRIFYYYTIATILASVLLEVMSWVYWHISMELLPVIFVGICLNLYLLLLVKSLLKKIDTSGHTYENQLHQFINGECKVDVNGVYPSTVVPNETA
ncbi:uncharacterized protein LOC123660937 [Melitaea cinxia]|uniref:uncharacterized protein LOC123660937 n=1 Tax=Melitaea cinxia TaxID=113334 RepID=UPI001E271EE1|nr:uncharacterized protein LOC123660937 [Melitaea cinxia]